MIERVVSKKIKYLSRKFPAVVVVGPRQSGKTTLCKALFPDKPYISLENADNRQEALEDPRGFLGRFPKGAILDEAQKAPVLFNYLQQILDDSKRNGLFILTGSNHFLMMESVTQSLAGRIAIATLLPFCRSEVSEISKRLKTPWAHIFYGGYPRIFAAKLKPSDWYPAYVQTYLERDVRQLKNVTNLAQFGKFMRLCAGRAGQELNMNALATELSVDSKTIQSWMSVLEMSFVVYLLKPYFKNFNKRVTKKPKLFFYDTGLACSLLGIQQESQLDHHPLRGALFENYVVMEILKNRMNAVMPDNLFHWRESNQIEVDLLIDNGSKQIGLEIKSGNTFHPDFVKSLKSWNTFSGQKGGIVVYGGRTERTILKTYSLTSWDNLSEL
ncbi:MAG: ATP-binding protein [Flavobacteriales bacterium]